MPKQAKRVIMLADCQSFYASIEKATHPEYANQPLVVAGDPARRSGIVLAACPLAKRYGIKTAERLGEAVAKCPQLVIIRPRMAEYIRVSMHITDILNSYTDLVEPYSIDEQYLDLTASLSLFGDPLQIAKHIQDRILVETGVYTRIGISENKVLSKMACDNFAKKNKTGIFWLHKEALPTLLWPLPVGSMFMVGSRMKRHLQRMGIYTIGDLAQFPLTSLKERWGINGEVLWRIANGLDSSPVTNGIASEQKGIGHQMTLPRDYTSWQEIKVVLLELAELVCQRCRAKGYMGVTVTVNCRGADFDVPQGFSRQITMAEPSNITLEVYRLAAHLFRQHWAGYPIRQIGVSLTGLVSDREYQLTLFGNREQKMSLERATDRLKSRFGNAVILRAVSLTEAGQARERAKKIGGHYK